MLLKTILNDCHKFKSFIYDKVRFVIENGERFIEVMMLPRRNSQAICSCCGGAAPLWAGEIPLKLSLATDPAFVPLFDWTKMQYSVLIEEIDLVYP